MPNFTSKSLGGLLAATAIVTAFTAMGSTSASAQTPPAIYGGGSTLVQFVIRDIFNCWGSVSNTSPTLGTTSCSTGVNSIDPNAGEVLYSAVGSGAGQSSYLANNPSLLGPPGNGTVPYTSGDYPAYPYPALTFAAGDAPLSASQVSSYNSAHQTTWGPAFQLPTLVVGIALPFNNSGLTFNNAIPAGGSSGFNLSRTNMCGIFSGNITDWSDTRLASDNGGTPPSSTSMQIKVIFRHDGSGTTFIASNSMVDQCSMTSYPIPTSWYPAGTPVSAAGNTSFFINAYTNGVLPANFYDEENVNGNNYGSGSTGIADAVGATTGAISYLSPDFVQPFSVPGHVASPAPNLENQYNVTHGTGVFLPPTAAGEVVAISGISPPAANSSATAWGLAGVSPNPAEQTAYPLSGFTWAYLYSCYSNVTTVDALLSGTTGLYKFMWSLPGSVGAGQYATILGAHSFAALPSNWLTAANHAAFRDAGTKMRRGGGANAAFCSTGI
jgi:ABC-type phosphate transport system substrate-binding protein